MPERCCRYVRLQSQEERRQVIHANPGFNRTFTAKFTKVGFGPFASYQGEPRPGLAKVAICAKLPLALTAALAIQRQVGSMAAFRKPSHKFRNCGIDSVVRPVDDCSGLTAVVRNLVGSAPASQLPATSAMRRKHPLQSLGCFPIADMRAVHSEQPVGAHSRSLDSSLRALAARKLLQALRFQRGKAAVNPAIHSGCY